MDNIVKLFMEDGYVICFIIFRCYMGVNGDGSKFINDWKGFSEMLIIVQKDSFNELVVIYIKVNEIWNFIKIYKERLEEKDRKEKIVKEWKVFVLIFD